MTSARKIKLKLAPHKPRNPLVAPAAQRKAGAHHKGHKTQRQAEQRALEKELAQ